MAALTLTTTAYRNPVIFQTLRLVSGIRPVQGRDWPDLPDSPALKAFYHGCCLSLLREQQSLEVPEALLATLQAFTRRELLELARWAREQLGLSTLPLLLLAEASVRYAAHACEAKQEVRHAIARLVRNGAEATQLLAAWLNVQGAGSKHKLPNALKKGLCEALANMSREALLQGPWALPMADLLRMIHARPLTAEQSACWRQILSGELSEQTDSFQELSLREQLDPAGLAAALETARLSPLRWLMLEREAETPELKAVLRQGLLNTRATGLAAKLGSETAIWVDTGTALLERLPEQQALQRLDIGAMLAALAGPDVLIGAFATEARWLTACANPVETALSLRQCELGWSSQAWKAVNRLPRSGIRRVVVFSSGEPEAELLACWQRYLCQHPQAMLCWVNVCAETTGLRLETDGSRIVKIDGWSEHFLTLISLLDMMQ